MNNFVGDLLIEYIDGKRWKVLQGFTYRLVHADGLQYVHIPYGFITDFASFPLQTFMHSPGGKWDKAAIVHDVLYKTGVVSVDGGDPRPMTRGECDDVLLEAMEVAGVDWFRRRIIYAGVRVGGWKAWNEHRKREREERERNAKSDVA